MKSNGDTIGEVAAHFGLEPHVLRHWEDEGLLRPERDGAGRRRYHEADQVRIAVILCNKKSGMSLDRIRELLDAGPADRDRILREHLERIERRIAELESAREMVAHALVCPKRDVATCERFQVHASELIERSRREKAAAARAHRSAAGVPV